MARKTKALPLNRPSTVPKTISSTELNPQKTVVESASDYKSEAKLRFRFKIADERNWPLHAIGKADHKKLIKRLKYFETLTVQQAKSNGVLSDYDMRDCKNKNAASILRNQHQGQDSLAKLVVEPSGPLRLFGIRNQNVIHILWWDSEHKIWPEGKIVR